MTVYWPHLTWYGYDIPGHIEDTPISVSDRRVGSKVGSTITSNSVHCFSFSPAVRIPPPPVLLRHPAHYVYSWEHWPPPLWEWTHVLAVCVHPDPNDFLSVWMCTSLIPKLYCLSTHKCISLTYPIHWLSDCTPHLLYSSFIYSVPCMAGCIWPQSYLINSQTDWHMQVHLYLHHSHTAQSNLYSYLYLV